MKSMQIGSDPRLPSLSEFDQETAEAWATEHSLPRYRGRQLYAALARRGVQEVNAVTDFPVHLRNRLSAEYTARSIQPRVHLASKVDRAEKVLFGLRDGGTIESVLIRSTRPGNQQRETVCVSSQVGCPAACSFCATGLGGFSRNLTAPEIVDQVMYFVHHLHNSGERVTNIVFMGMGEPLLNVGPVRDAVRRLTDPEGLGLGGRHITISTVGIVPQIRKFADWAGQVNLAISLHAPNDDLRTQLVPYNAHFPIRDLMQSVTDYVGRSRRRVSFEYVLLRGVNDAQTQAEDLARLLRPLGGMAHVNLIPWNPFREGGFHRTGASNVEAFATVLRQRHVNATIRYSKGLDISAACGQLRDQVSGSASKDAS